MTDPLPNERFYRLLDAYGAHPERWPAADRAAAVRCLVDSDAARAAWRDADALDSSLDLLPGDAASPALASRVAALAAAPAPRTSRTVAGFVWRCIPYAAAAAIALIVGLALPSPLREANPPSAIIAAAPVSEQQPTAAAPTGNLAALALIDRQSLTDEDTAASNDQGSDQSSEPQLAELPLL